MPRRPTKRKEEDAEEIDEKDRSDANVAGAPAEVPNYTESLSELSTFQIMEHLSQPSTSDVLSIISSTSIPSATRPLFEDLLSIGLTQIPPLDKCVHRTAYEKGVFGWGPPSGPEWCKFIIFLRHTSPLAVNVLSTFQDPYASNRFFIDFGLTRVPAFPHKFFFKQSEHPFDTVNVEGLGRDREVLVSLVPKQEEPEKRRVPIWLNVIGDSGRVLHSLQLGHFEYNQEVPLKTYAEQSTNRGWNFLEFLRQQRPTLEEAKFPLRYLVSELMGEPPPSERDLTLISNSNEMDTSSSTSIPPRKRRSISNISDTSKHPSTSKLQTRKRRSKSISVISNSLILTSPTEQVQQKYVTLKFTDPSPSVLGLPSLAQWSLFELRSRRRLIAFTCITDKARLIAEFTAVPVSTLDLAPSGSIVVSCIYVQDHTSQLQNSCIVTSYDFINLIKWMLGSPAWYEVDERNRVRRNLEVFSPVTLQKVGSHDYLDLFRQVTSYENPRPWNIQKDFKVFDWSLVETMMREIVKKYSVIVPEGDEVVGSLADVVKEDEDIEGEFLEAKRVLMADFMAHGGGTEIAGLPGSVHVACDAPKPFDPGLQFAIPMGISGLTSTERSLDDANFDSSRMVALATSSIPSTQLSSQNLFQSQPFLFTDGKAQESLLDETSPFHKPSMKDYNISSEQENFTPYAHSQDTLSNLYDVNQVQQLQSVDSGTVRPDDPTTNTEIIQFGSCWFGLDASFNEAQI